MKIKTLFQDFAAMIYPEYCIACEQALTKGEAQLCTNCRYELPTVDFHTRPDNELRRKFVTNIPLQHTLAYMRFTKTGKAQQLLHALKYEGNQEIGRMLGRWYGGVLSEAHFAARFDYILSVPLHPSKLRKRGYNQSDTFAQGLSEALTIPWSGEAIRRTKATDTQTRKNRTERWENVAEIFTVQDTEKVKDRRVLLVDDVVTTGATLESCLHTLYKAGTQELSVAVIAVAM